MSQPAILYHPSNKQKPKYKVAIYLLRHMKLVGVMIQTHSLLMHCYSHQMMNNKMCGGVP